MWFRLSDKSARAKMINMGDVLDLLGYILDLLGNSDDDNDDVEAGAVAGAGAGAVAGAGAGAVHAMLLKTMMNIIHCPSLLIAA